jgi:hypothetical protein
LTDSLACPFQASLRGDTDMQDRAEIIWNTYERLRRDVLLGDRCCAVCNGTLMSFAEAVAAQLPDADPLASPDALRFIGDDAMAAFDRAVERAATTAC